MNPAKALHQVHFTRRQQQAGFTLMEMMIVVAIIAIIVMLAIPAYQDYSIRAKISESLAVAAAAKTAITETCQINPLTTPSNSAAGYSFTASNYVATVIIGGTGIGAAAYRQFLGGCRSLRLDLYQAGWHQQPGPVPLPVNLSPVR